MSICDYKKLQFIIQFYLFFCNYVVAWTYNVLILIMLLYYISISVADVFMSKLYFKISYLWQKLLTILKYPIIKISKLFTVVAFLNTCPAYLHRHRFKFDLAFNQISIEIYVCCKETPIKPFLLVDIRMFLGMNLKLFFFAPPASGKFFVVLQL